MLNNVLFGVIGLLMTAITGVGVVSAAAHPEKVAEAGAEVVQVAERIVAQVQESAQKITLGTRNTQEQEPESTSTSGSDDSSVGPTHVS